MVKGTKGKSPKFHIHIDNNLYYSYLGTLFNADDIGNVGEGPEVKWVSLGNVKGEAGKGIISVERQDDGENLKITYTTGDITILPFTDKHFKYLGRVPGEDIYEQLVSPSVTYSVCNNDENIIYIIDYKNEAWVGDPFTNCLPEQEPVESEEQKEEAREARVAQVVPEKQGAGPYYAYRNISFTGGIVRIKVEIGNNSNFNYDDFNSILQTNSKSRDDQELSEKTNRNDAARRDAFEKFNRLLEECHITLFNDDSPERALLNKIRKNHKNFIAHINEYKKLFAIPFIKITLRKGEMYQVKRRFEKLALFHYVMIEENIQYWISAFAFYFLCIPEAYDKKYYGFIHKYSEINTLRSYLAKNEYVQHFLMEGNNYIVIKRELTINNIDILPKFTVINLAKRGGGGEEIEDSYTINYTI